jgi:ribosomal protein L11 methyltransferase
MREGLIPHTVTTVLRLDTDQASARRLTELFGELFDPEETGVAAFEDEASGSWRLEVYFASPPHEAAVRELLATVVGNAASKAVLEQVAARDWVAASLEGLKPVEAGRFVVHGAHDRAAMRKRPNRIGIEIEAALAFGTGHHGTTRGCLLALDAELKRRRPRNVLDVGTGTGVLAIAAAKALKRNVTATDIDPVAVTVAKENGKLNATPAYIRLCAAPGLRHSAVRRGSPFDLILANILYRPLTKLAPEIAKALAPGGTVVLSGLLLRDVPGILSAYRGCGLALARKGEIEGWATLVLKRGGAAARRPRHPGQRS